MSYPRRHAANQVKQATAFLTWLAARDHTLGTCGQTGIDAWHTEQNEYTRNTMRAFLLWCSASKLTRAFRPPPAHIRRATPMPQPERLELIGHLFADPDLSLRIRVAGVPAPVAAEALGYHRVTTAKLASKTGGTCSRDVAGDPWRSPPGWAPQSST
ncbi:hypothetical protein ABZT27_28835 [Streptomyces sp. NPDC005389]|uniref:hypothetical protein n=1 Tax=Streptomyces sp. NPDC005389 TaxID=3157040 RepID=UPI0033BF01A0